MKRARLFNDIKEGEKEIEEGKCTIGSVDEIMKAIDDEVNKIN